MKGEVKYTPKIKKKQTPKARGAPEKNNKKSFGLLRTANFCGVLRGSKKPFCMWGCSAFWKRLLVENGKDCWVFL